MAALVARILALNCLNFSSVFETEGIFFDLFINQFFYKVYELSKKIKTSMSDFIHNNYDIPASKTKNESIKNNKPFEAGIAAITERKCKKVEESFKWKKQN